MLFRSDLVRIAEKLAAPFPFVRVDLYDVDGKIYFGEMTFTPAKGTLIFDDDKPISSKANGSTSRSIRNSNQRQVEFGNITS